MPTRASPHPRLLSATWFVLAFACTGRGAAPSVAAPPDRFRCDKADSNECFAQVPGGTLLMGAQSADPAAPGYDPLANATEGPPHEVTVAPFWMMRSEVTVSTFARCVTEGRCAPDLARTGTAYTNAGHADRGHFSLNAISWEGASKVCAFLGGRLPTEAEWESAARAGDQRRWPWGNEPKCGVLKKTGMTSRTPEMSDPPCVNEGTVPIDAHALLSGYGFAAMGGNLAEWTEDLWHSYGEAPATGETRHVLRGGGWVAEDPAELRTTARAPGGADDDGPDVGFRCVWGAR